MARKANADSENTGRLKQIALTYKMTRKADPKVGLVVGGLGIVVFGVILGVGFLIGHPIYLGILGFLLAFLAMAIVFGRRAERAAFGQMEGKPGAAAAVLENVGRGWTTTPAIAMNRSQDVVHRAVGKAGVVLVAEGNPNRVKSLLAAEKRKMARIVVDVPVHDIIVGDGEGQVPLKKVRTTLLKLPRVLTGAQVTAANDRLRAMGDLMSNMPLPKGPMPKSARAPRGGRCADPRHTRGRRPGPPGPGRLVCRRRGRDAGGPVPQIRTWTARASRSWRPRPSRSQISAGMATQSSRLRTKTRPAPRRPPPSATTRRPSSRLPGVNPTVDTVSRLSTKKTSRAQLPADCCPPREMSPYAISMQSAQSMKTAPKRRPSGAIAPGPSSGSPSRLPR